MAGAPEGDDLPTLVALVEALDPHPAYLLGPMTRVLAWNEGASALFGAVGRLPEEHRFLLWWLFVDPGLDTDRPELRETARNMLARFRAEYAQHAGEPEFERFVTALRERSPEFDRWWEEHHVLGVQRGSKTVEHPTLGTLRLLHTQTVPTGAPDLRLTVYVPADEPTRAALATL